MLGVAFMAGTLVLTDTMNRTFDGLLSNAYAGTDAYVRGESAARRQHGAGPARRRVRRRRRSPHAHGVGAAAASSPATPSSSTTTARPSATPATGAPMMGETWITDEALNPYG